MTEKLWFEDLKYKSNPFTIKPQAHADIIGRDVVVKEIMSAISAGEFLVVEGDYGAGKTTFLKKLISKFGGAKRIVYFSCNRLTDDLDVDRLLLNRFGAVTRILRIKSKKMIALLDEAQYLSEQDIRALRQYHNAGYFKTVVLVTHNRRELNIPSSLTQQIKEQTYTLTELAPNDAVQLVRERIGEHPLMTEDVILRIYGRDGRIRAFLKNCETFMRHMSHRKLAKASDVDKILDEFKF